MHFYSSKYEDIVEDFGLTVEQLLVFLGLEWDDAVLNYTDTAKKKLIATPSYQAVSNPIYKRAKFRWHRYARQLQPVLAELQPFLDDFSYSAAPPSSELVDCET